MRKTQTYYKQYQIRGLLLVEVEIREPSGELKGY